MLNKNFSVLLMIIGSLLLMGTGLHMAWGLWHFGIQPWAYELNFYVYVFIISSFYVGAIMGNIVGSVLVNLWRKTIIYVSATRLSKLCNYFRTYIS